MGNTDVYPATAPAPARRRPAAPPDPLARIVRAARAASATNLRLALTIGGGAFLLRAAWVLAVHRHGWAVNDALFYDIFASQLAAGHGYTLLNGDPSAAWPPAYPFVLSIAFRTFGSKPIVGELTNAFIGALTVPLLYLVALRMFGRREAIYCAVALALFPVHVFFPDVLVTETWVTFLLVLLFAALVELPRTRVGVIPIGLLIGVAGLSHGEGLLLVVVPIVVWWSELVPRERLVRAVILVAAAALVVAPWTMRNQREMDARVLVSTNGGQTLYAGHNPGAYGGPTYPPPALIAKYKAIGGPEGEIAQDKALRSKAISWAKRHPADELLLIPKKFIAWMGGDGAVFGTWINPQGSLTPAIPPFASARWSLLANVAWYWLLGAFIFAVAVGRSAIFRRPANPSVPPIMRGIFAWLAVETAMYCFVTFGQWRYHVPLEPLMLLVTAPVVVAFWARRRELQQVFAGPSAPVVQRGKESPC